MANSVNEVRNFKPLSPRMKRGGAEDNTAKVEPCLNIGKIINNILNINFCLHKEVDVKLKNIK